MNTSWNIERLKGSGEELHARETPEPVGRLVSILEVNRSALVLGSTQPETDVDKDMLERKGIDLVRRRSGGGAVLLVPGESVWVDVVVPRGDQLWSDDVSQAFYWLGKVWVDALERLGHAGVAHLGPLVCSQWSRRICFAGVGGGEVRIDNRKVVGISQRRQRQATRFQCMALKTWMPEEILELMAMSEEDRNQARIDIEKIALGIKASSTDIEEAFIDSLP